MNRPALIILGPGAESQERGGQSKENGETRVFLLLLLFAILNGTFCNFCDCGNNGTRGMITHSQDIKRSYKP